MSTTKIRAEQTNTDSATQTLTNKTLTTPVITSLLSGTGTVTIQQATDTLVGRATTDTLTNKTLTSPVLNTGVSGTAIDTTTTLGTFDTKVASQKAVKTYVDTAPSDWSNVYASRAGSAQSITSGTSATTVVFNSEAVDTNSEYNNSTGIFTAKVAGYYSYYAQVSWSPGFTGPIRTRALCAGSQHRYIYNGSVSSYTPVLISGSVKLTVGQTIYIDVRQESGSTRSVYHDGGLTNLSIVRVR